MALLLIGHPRQLPNHCCRFNFQDLHCLELVWL
jgi:hypothetical protein